MDRGVWWATVHGAAESDMAELLEIFLEKAGLSRIGSSPTLSNLSPHAVVANLELANANGTLISSHVNFRKLKRSAFKNMCACSMRIISIYDQVILLTLLGLK